MVSAVLLDLGRDLIWTATDCNVPLRIEGQFA